MRKPPTLYIYILAALVHQSVSWLLSVLAPRVSRVYTRGSQRLKSVGLWDRRCIPLCFGVRSCLLCYSSFPRCSHSHSYKHCTHSLVLPFTCWARKSCTLHTPPSCSTAHSRL
jgi:hypothetical protein